MQSVILFGPGIRYIPEAAWHSKFFWVSLVLLIVGSIVYQNFFRKNGKQGLLFGRLKPGEAKISYSSDGPSGQVHYRSAEARFSMYYEFGGGDCIVSIDIPNAENWEKTTGLPLARRDEVLDAIGQQVVRDQTNGGRGHFKIEGDWLHIYA
jgi:hypothetical protein